MKILVYQKIYLVKELTWIILSTNQFIYKKKDNPEEKFGGIIQGAFGKAGKFTVYFEEPIFNETMVSKIEEYQMAFPIKRYIFDENRTINQ